MAALHDLTALEQAAAIRSGDITAVELTEHYLNRSGAHGDEVGAFVRLTPELALDQARAADALVRASVPEIQLPPLLGVVCPIKDLEFVAGVKTSFGSLVFDVTPLDDDNMIGKLRAGGLVFTGKTNTPEFGLPCYTEPDIAPPARTPWALDRSAGGSSGGAAAAVSAGLAPFAQGSDGGGSIRIPASVTGLVGIKPCRGRISSGPIKDSVGDITTLGPLARNVADAAALLDAMAGEFPGDPFTAVPPKHGTFLDAAKRDPGVLRIGFYTQPALMDTAVHPDVLAAVAQTVTALTDLGHEVEEIAPPFNETVRDPFVTLWSVLSTLIPIAPEDEPDLRPLSRYLREKGHAVSGPDLALALSVIRMLSRAAVESTDAYDVVLAPTLADLPAMVGQLRDDDNPAGDFEAQMRYTPFTAVYNATGQPSINVPMNWNADGLPIGVQFVGRMHDEETLISLAAQLEQAHSWLDRQPGIW